MAFTIVFMGLSFHRMHLLSALLCLEGMMITIFVALSFWPLELSTSLLLVPLTTLTMAACEAGLGLSLMIATARSHGTDNLKTTDLLQC
uniref:NADH-ubiquinone oxidoreductase chain 4L n=1 Tax=Minervarya manoharani TaxID=3372176 RepID=A0A343L6P3_9NEOB|nr:NADH dehydrogenase subunit 4L [Fejervarya manoharani]